MWQVIRLDSHAYTRPKYSKYGRSIGVEIVTDPPNTVVGEHCVKETAEKHRDKCNKTMKPLRYEIRKKQ